MQRPVLAATLLLTLGGCTVGPNFTPPKWASPASWFGPTKAATQPAKATVRSVPVAAPVDVAWWNLFHDPKLTALEQQVAADNLDVQTATVRLAESRAQLGIVGAGRYPFFNANGSYQRQKPSDVGLFSGLGTKAAGGQAATVANGANGAAGNTTGAPLTPAGINPFDVYQYGFDATWEPDIWGQVRRSMEAAGATVQATAEERRAVLLTALAEVARDYIDLRGTQEQLRIARENLRTAQQSLNLTKQRAAAGVTTDLDVANASAQVSTTAAEIPILQQREKQTINALSLLLGKPPNALATELSVPEPVPPVPPRVPVGFPSELALRRPDIRAAEAKLHAATAEVGVATAAFYPTITLSASFGFQALQFGNLWKWDARQYAMGPGITMPIFQGGQLKYTLVLRKDQEKEAAIAYTKTVLSAWHDVANALIAYEAEQRRRAELIQAVAQNRKALALAQSRYQEGVADFLAVLDAERRLLSTEQQLALSTTTISTNLVALYKALGGGWQNTYPIAGPVTASESRAERKTALRSAMNQ